MAWHERIVYQPYARGKRGFPTPGQAVDCRDRLEAQRRAEKAMAAGHVVGAHIVRVLADEEAGDYGEPEYLAVFGTVPDLG